MVAMTPEVLRGEPAKLASLYGSGYGYGDGYGDGSGDGDGYGYGDGSGDGDGSGSGYGDGDGYGSGDGYGDGDGDGYGYGDGSGDGYGDGDGYGYGYGSGDGDGDGYGYGDGSGDGDGYGSGYGSGDGDGYGYGYGSGDYWKATVAHFSAKWPRDQQARLTAAVDEGAKIAFWRSNERGLPANGGEKIEAAAPGVIHTSPGPLQTCHRGTLHATLIPPKWSGERCWIVALWGEVVGDDEKFGCLKREILGEAL